MIQIKSQSCNSCAYLGPGSIETTLLAFAMLWAWLHQCEIWHWVCQIHLLEYRRGHSYSSGWTGHKKGPARMASVKVVMGLGIMEGVVDIPHLVGLRKYVWFLQPVLLSANCRTIHPYSRCRCHHRSHCQYLEWKGQWGICQGDASFDHSQDSRTLKIFDLSELK